MCNLKLQILIHEHFENLRKYQEAKIKIPIFGLIVVL